MYKRVFGKETLTEFTLITASGEVNIKNDLQKKCVMV
jgi:hypothetical protein